MVRFNRTEIYRNTGLKLMNRNTGLKLMNRNTGLKLMNRNTSLKLMNPTQCSILRQAPLYALNIKTASSTSREKCNSRLCPVPLYYKSCRLYFTYQQDPHILLGVIQKVSVKHMDQVYQPFFHALSPLCLRVSFSTSGSKNMCTISDTNSLPESSLQSRSQ